MLRSMRTRESNLGLWVGPLACFGGRLELRLPDCDAFVPLWYSWWWPSRGEYRQEKGVG